MPIALLATSRVADAFQKNGIERLFPDEWKDIHWMRYDRLIVQLDIPAAEIDDHWPLPGWNWLTKLLIREKSLLTKPILLTAWQEDLLVHTQFRDELGPVQFPMLLRSPLIKFVPLRELFRQRNQLDELFDSPLSTDIDDDYLHHDLTCNLLEGEAAIHEYLHYLKEKVRKTDSSEPDQFWDELRRQFEHFFLWFRKEHGSAYELAETPDIDQNNIQNLLQKEFRSKEDFLDKLEKLGQLVRTLMSKQTSHSTDIKATILYLDDNRDDAKKIKRVLKYKGVYCHWVKTEAEAKDYLQKRRERLCAVISDFRLYDADGRLARRQGYHILQHLRGDFNELKYAFLSSRKGLVNHLPEDLKWQWPEFKKSELLAYANQLGKNTNGGIPPALTELIIFVTLAEQARVERVSVMNITLEKRLNAWEYKKRQSWLDEKENSIEQEALQVIKQYHKRGDTAPSQYDGLGSHFKKKWDEYKKCKYLYSRMIQRRLVLGLINSMQVDRKSPRNMETWRKIYVFLTRGNTEEPMDDTIQKAFSALGFRTRQSYLIDNPEIRGHILPSEYKWLKNHEEELKNHTR